MLIDDVFSLARRVAPRGAGVRRGVIKAGNRASSTHVRREPQPTSISRDVLCLQPDRPLDTEVAPGLVDAVLNQLATCEPAPVVVVLTLESTPEIDEDSCEALVELYYKLRASGVRLYVGALAATVFARMRETGVVERLGEDAVWPSLQTALLSAYEELSGPAIVTRSVVAALQQRLVPLPL